jgi:hypothetical protein
VAVIVELALIRAHRMNEDRPARPERPTQERDRDVA